MKICIISSYPPEKEGVGEFTKRFVDNFKNSKVNIYILTFKYNSKPKNKNVFTVLGMVPNDLINTYNKLISIKPDIIHIQYATPVFRILSPILWLLIWYYKTHNKVKILVTFHEITREIELLKFIGIKYYSIISSISDNIVVHTREASNILHQKCKIELRKINIIPLGLYCNHYNHVYKKLTRINNVVLSKKEIVLFFGYIHEDKGIEFLIQALKSFFIEYPTKENSVLLIIAGDVRPRKGFFKFFELLDHIYLYKLKRLTKDYRIEKNIRFVGFIDKNDIFPLIQFSKVVVLPYKKVEQSGVLNIALNLRVPIIASSIGGLGEILNKTKLTVKPKNSDEIKLKLVEILINKNFKNYLNSYDEIINNNSLSKVIDNYQKLYLKMSKWTV